MSTSINDRTLKVLACVGGLLTAVVLGSCSLIVAKELPEEDGFCGDGVLQRPDEQCDGSEFGGATCKDFNGPNSEGELICTAACVVEIHECTDGGDCGNSLCETGENVTNCPQDCNQGSCDNGQCEPHENAETCPSDCGGAAVCGDGQVSGFEECDGDDMGGLVCNDLGFDAGFLRCRPDCTWDFSNCMWPVTCGDGAVDQHEYCDDSNLNGHTCDSLGFNDGTLTCRADCKLDATQCFDVPGRLDGENCNGPTICKGDLCFSGEIGGILVLGYCSSSCDNFVCVGRGICLVDGPGGPGPLCYEPCTSASTCHQGLSMACTPAYPGAPTICWPPQQ